MKATHSPLLQTSSVPLEARRSAQNVHTSRAFRRPPNSGPYSDLHSAMRPRLNIPLALSTLDMTPSGKLRGFPPKEVDITRDT
jgi:hypothetical protein